MDNETRYLISFNFSEGYIHSDIGFVGSFIYIFFISFRYVYFFFAVVIKSLFFVNPWNIHFIWNFVKIILELCIYIKPSSKSEVFVKKFIKFLPSSLLYLVDILTSRPNVLSKKLWQSSCIFGMIEIQITKHFYVETNFDVTIYQVMLKFKMWFSILFWVEERKKI